MALLEVKDIEKSFGKTEVLKGVSFSMEKGEVLSIIGSSGSGKTTLLRCMNFLETTDSGTMVLNGEKLIDGAIYKENELRSKRLHFGLVFQQFNLFPQHSVLKNIFLAPNLLVNEKVAIQQKETYSNLRASGVSWLKAKKESAKAASKTKAALYEENKKNAYALLERVGLSEKANNYPMELSGGQQQRVAIARALALNPDILCFDEPTSALDPELTGEVLKVIKELRSDNRTMIIVTHEMEFAREVSNKIIYMANGKIEVSGTPEEVFSSQNGMLKSFLNN